MTLALKKVNNTGNTIKINDLEEKVTDYLSKSLDCNDILYLIDLLNNYKQSTVNLNLDINSSVILFLNELR